jgi:hypothetical protein
MTDNWYVNENEFLPLRSNSYLGLNLYFIDAGGSVDFDLMAREHGRIYTFLLEKFHLFMGKYFEMIAHTIFQKDGQAIDYHTLEADILECWRKKGAAQTIKELREQPDYWDVINTHLKASKEGRKRCKDMISKESGSLEYDILDLVTGRNAARYGNSLRSYIIERCKETGIYKFHSLFGQRDKKRIKSGKIII